MQDGEQDNINNQSSFTYNQIWNQRIAVQPINQNEKYTFHLFKSVRLTMSKETIF